MNKKGEDQNRNKSKNKNKNIKDDGTIEFYKNGMNRLHSGNKILVAEDDLIKKPVE